ncbi:hypothetical protein J2W56_003862 [Nocardia kruczakiae]|uniref:Uncharacterized protein n=1 Tax=Nocardia kruczakiae TaxID=261477 RepID=A0ABU1XJ78_9NOCA|nr:hypothetical protein [Nocardia kruczakiae]MDR7170111.1 hypothetical protein [Nocardia kruczakiae]
MRCELREAATGTTIAGVQNHFNLGDRPHRSVLGRAAARDSGIAPASWDRFERAGAVA